MNDNYEYYYAGIFYNGFSVATSTFPSPLGAYLGCTLDNLNTVDIWIKSHSFHGTPLAKVSQTSGSFAPSNIKAFSLPLTGWANLDLYTTSLINLYIYTYPNKAP